jgi:tetratricopeptide (TPR) repeat protein
MPRAAALALDSRHDHSIRVPRPDLSVRLGTPNACKGCHTDRTDEWAAAAIRRHHPDPRPGFQSFGEAFDAADRDRPGAQRRLLQVVRDPGQPGIVRASALSRLARRPDAIAAEFAAALLADPDVLVRIAAVRVLAVVPPAERPGLLAAALEDPVLAVRIAAGRALAGADPERLSAPQRAALARALDEYVAAQDANADLVESRIEVGRLYAENGRPHEAAAAFAQALALEPDSREAAQGLAAARRAAGAKPARPE